MKIKRTEKRIAAIGAHPFFLENEDAWKALKNGEAIDVPEDEYESIHAVFGNSITVVKNAPKLSVKTIVEKTKTANTIKEKE